jgi:hypothetical protein
MMSSSDNNEVITLKSETTFVLAYTLYNIHILQTGEEAKDWIELTKEEQVYWCTLTVGLLQSLSSPSKGMVKAALKEMRKPVLVADGKSWDEANGANFKRYFTAAIKSLIG